MPFFVSFLAFYASLFFFFFFQAEDGIRDLTVTGVQTCALPISWDAPPAATLSPLINIHEFAYLQHAVACIGSVFANRTGPCAHVCVRHDRVRPVSPGTRDRKSVV